jgi:hypothetical protein
VALEVKTDNGTVTFLGTLNRERTDISGDYKISGGNCGQTGTAVSASPGSEASDFSDGGDPLFVHAIRTRMQAAELTCARIRIA